MPQTHLRVERDPDGVGRIVLDRPEAKNTLTIAMRDGIIDAVREFRADPKVRAVLITGDGDAFCAGMDLERVDRRAGGQARLRDAHDVRGAPRRRADVHPRAVGARQAHDRGRERCRGRARARTSRSRATSCWCTRGTRFIWTFAKWGLVADAGGAYLLPRLVGLPRAKAMLMLGEGAVGAEAVDMGLAYRCVDEPDALLPEALALTRRLAAGPTRSLGLSKRLLNASFETDLSDSLELEGYFQALATDVARSRRGHGRVPREARRQLRRDVTAWRDLARAIQRVAAYNVCIDDATRLLMCRLSDITERPGVVDAARRRHRLRRAPRSGARSARAQRGDRATSAASSSCSRSTRCGARCAPRDASTPSTTASASSTAPRIVARRAARRDRREHRPGRVVHARGARDDAARRARAAGRAARASESTDDDPHPDHVRPPWRGC